MNRIIPDNSPRLLTPWGAYLLIESTGISEPLPVAATFDFRDENDESLSDVARLDAMVTVVDAISRSMIEGAGMTAYAWDAMQEIMAIKSPENGPRRRIEDFCVLRRIAICGKS